MNAAPEDLGQGIGFAYEGTTASVGSARLDLDAWLADRFMPEKLRQRAELVVSELVSNAVQASDRTVTVNVAVCDDRLHIAVTNEGDPNALPAREQWRPSEVLAVRGRGLAIVEALAEKVTVSSPSDGSVTVAAALRVAA